MHGLRKFLDKSGKCVFLVWFQSLILGAPFDRSQIFTIFSEFWPHKIKIFSIFILSFFTQNCLILMFYIIGIGQNVDIYPSKRL